MAIVTGAGLKKAASNLFWLPFRVVLVFFEWLTKILMALVLVVFLATATLGAYFYVKSDQPMPIDPRFAQQPPEGMTFREFWRDRFEGWAKLEEQNFRSGKWKVRYGCRITALYWFVPYQVVAPIVRIYYVRFKPNSPMAEVAIRGMNGIIAPDDLNLLDALWWQFVNETWFYWKDDGLVCSLPPPKRPVQASP